MGEVELFMQTSRGSRKGTGSTRVPSGMQAVKVDDSERLLIFRRDVSWVKLAILLFEIIYIFVVHSSLLHPLAKCYLTTS